MVFAGIYPSEADDYQNLREALDKLQLNDASLTFQPEIRRRSVLASGRLPGPVTHEIIQERLEREYDLKWFSPPPRWRMRSLAYVKRRS